MDMNNHISGDLPDERLKDFIDDPDQKDCPFCGEAAFELPELKRHLLSGKCQEFEETK